jgi:hypothetical protein
MTTSSESDYSHIDIDKVLKSRGQVAIVWSIEDVQGLRPDLNAEQSWDVLAECRDKHDSEWGFTYSFIWDVADRMFPRPKPNQPKK